MIANADASIQTEGGLWRGLILLKKDVHHITAFLSHQISTQLNTHERFMTHMLDSALHHHHQNCKRGTILGEGGASYHQ